MFRLTPPYSSDAARMPRACVQCARAKVKCEIDTEDGVCQRCRRLKKQCNVQMPGAHRRKRQRPNTSDVARLEQKLDNVTAILSASEQARAHTNLWSQNQALTPSFEQSSFLSPAESVQQFVENDNEAELILDNFRQNIMPYFPFVIIPPEVSSDDLKQEKPFLFMAVMMAGCRHNTSRQTEISRKIREVISYRIIIKGEQSLDILQGLLIYLAWYHLHLRINSQLTNLFYLIMAMMTDLSLNNATHPKNPSKLSPGVINYFDKDGQLRITRTLEERRAYLGCFYVTSVVSLCARAIDPVKYTKYTDECCHVITEAAEYPTDIFLVHLVHLHRLADKIRHTLSYDELESSSGISAPIRAYVRSLESELLQLKESLALDIPHSADLLMNYYMLEVILYEVALYEKINTLRYGNSPMARVEILLSCLNSTKACFDTFSSFPLSSYLDMPFILWTQMGHALIVLSKLGLFNGDGWDQEYVYSQLDFSEAVDKFGHRLEEAKESCRLSTSQIGASKLPPDIPAFLLKITPKLQQIKECHEARRQAQRSRNEQTQDMSRERSSVSNDDLAIPDAAALFEFLDDSFWTQFT